MKIKIVDEHVHKYEDVTQGKVYEVVDDYYNFYLVIDDQFDGNEILREHCEIVTEETMFKKGDRVKIDVNTYDGIILIQEWSLEGKEGMCGEIIGLPSPRTMAYVVRLDNGGVWYVPEELLQKLPCEDDDDKPVLYPTLNEIIRFTQKNKGFSVSFEDGNITLSDWSNDPNATFYRPKTIEEMLELMELIEKINEYKFDNE